MTDEHTEYATSRWANERNGPESRSLRQSIRLSAGSAGLQHIQAELRDRADEGLPVTEAFALDLVATAASWGHAEGFRSGWEERGKDASDGIDSLRAQNDALTGHLTDALATADRYRRGMRKAVDLLFSRNREVQRLKALYGESEDI